MTFTAPSQASDAEPGFNSMGGSVCCSLVGIEDYHQQVSQVPVFKTFKKSCGSFKFSDPHTFMDEIRMSAHLILDLKKAGASAPAFLTLLNF